MQQRPAEPFFRTARLPDLGWRLVTDLIRLVRLDVKYALASIRDVAVSTTQGTVLMLAGTLVGMIGLFLLLTGLGLALALVLPGWLLAFVGGATLLGIAIPVAWRSWQTLTGS